MWYINAPLLKSKDGRIVLSDLKPGTVITAKETATVDGFVLDGTPKSIEIKEGEAQTLTFYNTPVGGLELIKVSESDKSQRIKGVTFEIREMDGGLVDTITTGDNGRVFLPMDAGDFYAVEIEAAEGFKIDSTPHYFTIQDGKTTTLTVTNSPFSGIIIHKVNSVTGEGIYDVKFLLYDQNKNPIGEYSTDNEGTSTSTTSVYRARENCLPVNWKRPLATNWTRSIKPSMSSPAKSLKSSGRIPPLPDRFR